jgi:hypothetical protein
MSYDTRWVVQLTDRSHSRDGMFVSEPGSMCSYTPSLRQARKFATADQARDAACGNETPVSIAELLP